MNRHSRQPVDPGPPTECVECSEKLPEGHESGFCSKTCEDRYCYASTIDFESLIRDMELEAAAREAFYNTNPKYLN